MVVTKVPQPPVLIPRPAGTFPQLVPRQRTVREFLSPGAPRGGKGPAADGSAADGSGDLAKPVRVEFHANDRV